MKLCLFVCFYRELELNACSTSYDDTLEDAWDGSVLSELSAQNRFFCSDHHHLALSLFTDGVPLYKSSGVSIWPVYVVILNLPANVRMNASSMILCGIWNGPAKPSMSILCFLLVYK